MSRILTVVEAVTYARLPETHISLISLENDPRSVGDDASLTSMI
jgi:hypothetical protein